MNIRPMLVSDYAAVYDLWMSCAGMGLNDLVYRNKALTELKRIDT